MNHLEVGQEMHLKGENEVINTDFNDFQDCYKEQLQNAISFIGQDLDYFTEVKARYLCEIAKKYLGNTRNLSVLDLGCGVGLTDRFLNTEFRKLYGIDISEGIIEKAALTNPSVCYQVYDGKRIPFTEESMDIVFTVCVMHHISPSVWLDMIREFHRVLKKGGLLVIFEHNPFNPLTRRVVNNCKFDADAVLLTQYAVKNLINDIGLNLVEGSYILFFPFRGPVFSILDRILRWLPLGAQYYVVGRKV